MTCCEDMSLEELDSSILLEELSDRELLDELKEEDENDDDDDEGEDEKLEEVLEEELEELEELSPVQPLKTKTIEKIKAVAAILIIGLKVFILVIPFCRCASARICENSYLRSWTGEKAEILNRFYRLHRETRQDSLTR